MLLDWRPANSLTALLCLAGGGLRSLFVPPGFGGCDEGSMLWDEIAETLRDHGLAMRPLREWGEPEYACDWGQYRRWRVPDAAERPGAAVADLGAVVAA